MGTKITPLVVAGGYGPAAAERLAAAIRAALAALDSGATPQPIFPVAPGTDLAAAAQEATELGIPPTAGVLMRTSGSTTGTGKIVALSWAALQASAQATAQALGATAWAAWLPTHHIAGFQTVARSVWAGTAPAQFDPADPIAATAWLDSLAGATGALSVVPTQLQKILAQPAATAAWRRAVLLVGGAATNAELLAAAREQGLRVVTSYGMTETAGGCVYDGKPIGDTQISIADDARISIAGSVVALGYLGAVDPAAFTVTSTGTRMHHTQDIGELTAGTLTVLGRRDDAITTGGLTVMPRLIEETIAKAGYQSVVVGIPDPKWGEAVVAVLAAPCASCVATAIKSYVKVELGPGWAPHRFISVADIGGEFPLTESGKIDRRRLRGMVESLG
ncbi:MAG: AMP-binding protein [Trueperella sp.]|nr:AMP-binding protein [Trueperella sp.]